MATRCFGEIEGFPVGSTFENRKELAKAGVHRHLQAGIVGSQTEGAESIVVSGGYEDDQDTGDELVYTGHGGNDPATGQQVADQQLHRGNKALDINCEKGLLVRVIRGARGEPPYAPSKGYRYDGLYKVEECWEEEGLSGFKIWRFKLRREDPAPPPWTQQVSPRPEVSEAPRRSEQKRYSASISAAKVAAKGKRLIFEGRNGRLLGLLYPKVGSSHFDRARFDELIKACAEESSEIRAEVPLLYLTQLLSAGDIAEVIPGTYVIQSPPIEEEDMDPGDGADSGRPNRGLKRRTLNKVFLSALGDAVARPDEVKLDSFPLELELEGAFVRSLRVYLFNATSPPGGRSADEVKIQLIAPGQRPGQKGDLDVSGSHLVLLSGYERNRRIYIFWDAYTYSNFSYSRMVTVKRKTITEAYALGIGGQTKSRKKPKKFTENVVCCDKSHLIEGLKRRYELNLERLLGR